MSSTLDELVAVTGEAYAVPGDGFRRVRDAMAAGSAPAGTEDIAPAGRRAAAVLSGRAGAGLAVAAALVVALALAVVPGSSSPPARETAGVQPANGAAGGGGAGPTGVAAPAPGAQAKGAPSLGAPAQGLVPSGRSLVSSPPGTGRTPVRGDGALVVRQAAVEVEVPRGRVASGLARVEEVATASGGYVASSSASLGTHDATAVVTIRVPVTVEPTVLRQVEQVGTVRRETQSGEDVTGAHADLLARLRALTASRDRYLAILTRARSTGDVLAVQQSIDGVQSQIEQLQAQQTDLEQRSALAALTVTLVEPGAATAGRGPWEQALHEAWSGFTSGAQRLLADSGRALLLVLLALALWAAARTGRQVWRRRRLTG